MNNDKLIHADQTARHEILDISQSFIVQAPAGSGKTECLTQRYLALLASGVTNPEEIIAITFTRKATHEMQSRIIAALHAAREPEPEEPHKQITWELANRVLIQDKHYQWQLLENPHRLRITTIDSLCTSLVKQMPITTEFGGLPEIVENADSLYNETADNILQQLVTNGLLFDDLHAIADYYDNDFDQLRQLLTTMLKTRTHWQNYLLRQDINRCQLDSNRSELVNHFINSVSSRLSPHLGSLLNLLQQVDFVDNAFWLPLITNDFDDDIQKWKLISKFLLTQKGEWRKRIDKSMGIPSNKANKPITAEIKHWIEQIQTPELLFYLQTVLTCPSPQYSNQEWKILSHILTVLPIACAELRNVFKLHQQVDFTEISLSALAALNDITGPTDLALRLDYQIKHLLIDEFQDTSIIQYQLLCQLTLGWEIDDGRSLFLVGDPMQSIYRFREAEVSLFNYVQQFGLPNVALSSVKLYLNFRSEPELIEWNNQLCLQLFPLTDKPEAGEIAFTPSTSIKKSANDFNVKYHFESSAVNVARRTFEICQQCLLENPNQEIAILIRSRNHIPEIINQLQENDLNYHLHDIKRTENIPVIQDLIALTCALLDPDDKIAWLACLRAPYIGLNLQEITALVSDISQPISQLIKQSEHPQLIRFNSVITFYKPHIEQYPISQWLESIWEDLGGFQVDATTQNYNICHAYFNYLASLTEPLTREKIQQNIHTIDIKNTSNNANIHILTIHKSKGLEFDTVIIPHCEKETSSQLDKKLLTILEWYHPKYKEHLLLIAPNYLPTIEENSLYGFIEEEQKQKFNAELQRLFYVAVTRAKSSLHFVSQIETAPEKEFKPGTQSFLNYTLPNCQEQLDKYLLSVSNTTIEKKALVASNQLKRVIFPAFINPSKDETLTVNAGNTIEYSNQTVDQIVGTIIHQYLYQFSLHENLSPLLLSAINPIIPRICLASGIQPQNIASATTTIETALLNCLNDKNGNWILSQRVDAYSEYPIVVNKKVIRLDRTFCFDNTQWIIDYKISTLLSTSLDLKTIQQKHADQLNLYATALKQIISRPIQCAIYLPLQQQLFHWPAFDEQA